jgi:uncharacterized membrane protein YcaP (DUF421 family)
MTLPITRDRCLGLNAAFPYLDRRWPWRERGSTFVVGRLPPAVSLELIRGTKRFQARDSGGNSVSVDWHSVFVPSLGIAEMVVRGTLMYLALFAILRFIGRRQAGHFGPADLLVIVLIADAAQNGLGKDYESVTEGIVLVLTIVAWEYALDWAAWRYPSLRPYLKPLALTLVQDGKLVSSALRKEMLSRDELDGQLREQGIEELSEVKLARLEGDGRLSVIKRLRAPHQEPSE